MYLSLHEAIADATARLTGVPGVAAVTAGPGAPAGDLKAILAWMKANPAKANFGRRIRSCAFCHERGSNPEFRKCRSERV